MPGPNPNSTRFIPQRKRDDVPFSYTPSEPFDLGAVPWHPHSQAPNELPEVPEAVKSRNDALLSSLREEVGEKYEEREDLGKALRWRGAVWARQAVGDRLGEIDTPIDEELPQAFQFHHHPDSMKLHWTRGSKADENALVRPTPSHLFVTPRPRAGPLLHAPPQATSSSMRARISLDPQASASASPTLSAPATPALQEGTTSATPASASTIPQGQGGDDCLLTISIYSRPLLKPDRRTLLRTVAAKGYEERRKVEQERAASMTKKGKRGCGQSGQDDDDDDDDDDEPASSQAGSSKDRSTISHRDTPLFASHFGPTSSSADSSSSFDSSLPLPRPSQIIELYASQSLQDLRDAIVCRMDDLPERDAAAEQTGGGGGLRFTGRKRRDDAVMMIEGLVVGQEKDSQLVEAMLKADTSKARRAAPPGVTMDTQRLDSLGVPVRLHTPYWYAHQDGACEHFWVIDQVRKPTAYDPPPPLPFSSNTASSSNSAEQPTYRTPLTLYLSSSALSRPLPLYEQPCAGEHQYGMGRCKLCDRDQALFAVVGGAAAVAAAQSGGRGGGDEGVAVGVRVGEGNGPPNLPEQVMALCKRCALLWSGRAPRSVAAAATAGMPQEQATANGEASSSGSQPASQVNGNVNGKRKRARITTSRDRDRDRAGASRGRSGFGPGRGRGRGRGGGGVVARERSSDLQPGDGVDHDLDESLQPVAAPNCSSAPSSPLPLPRAPAPASAAPAPAPLSPAAISQRIAAKAVLNADISGDATWRALCGVVEGQAEDRRSGAGAGAAVQPWSVVPLLD